MMSDVIIIGGGLSGLAAAVELATRGAKVTLYEQSLKLGGRCYSYTDETTGDVVDNGQHVLVGAYHNTLRYLEMIGTRSFLKEQTKLELPFYHPEKGFSTFKVSSLPKPLDLTAGMLQFSLLSFGERMKLLNVGLDLQTWDATKEESLKSLSIDQWLTGLKQSDEAKKCFWNPIAVSVMNELPEQASALLFARSLRATFLGKKSDSAILVPTIGQTELYVHGAEELLKKHKASVYINKGVERIVFERGKVLGVEVEGKVVNADAVVSSVPYFAIPALIGEHVNIIPSLDDVGKFKSVPIVSIHCWFDKEFMDYDFVGLIDLKLQWVFNRRRLMNESGKKTSYISAVISGAYETVGMSKDELVRLAIEDLQKSFPKCKEATLVHSVVIKEKRATFSSSNDIEDFRPNTETGIKNLFLAGDWTNTGLPATIEGAVGSGFRVAEYF